MSTTIDSLDIQISTSVGNSATKIEELATALGNLKNNSKITTAVNALGKLATALNTLNPALGSLDTSKLKELETSVSGLSGITKLSGLESAITTLQKLPAIVNDLDNTNLAKFSIQLEKLSNALSPLATQIDKIGTGFSKLPSRVSQVVTATNKMTRATEKSTKATKEHSSGLNTSSINLMSAISNFQSVVSVLDMVTTAISSVMSQAMEWDGIQHRFGRAFGEDAEEVYSYVQKINDAMGINIQQFMQYSSLYGSLLSGFGMSQEKVTTISVGLTELSYDIWAAYNDRFKTLEDASEAVRSAITGEIEPIRNAGIALTEASLQEYLDSVGMAEVSIEKLSEAQKAEVRYAAMFEAAMNQDIVGAYAGEMKTAEGVVRDLSQSFKTLTQSFGSLFIPIIQEAIPYVTAFVNVLVDAVQWIANLFNITLFEIDWGDTSGLSTDLGDAADNAGDIGSGLTDAADAASEIKDYLMGFDELNVISPTTDTDSSSGSGGSDGSGVDWGDGLDLETLWDDSVFKKAERQVDELKEKIIDWFNEWKTEIAIVAAALSALSITSLLGNLGEALGLGEKFLETLQSIKRIASLAIVLTIQYSLVSEFLKNFIETGEWEHYLWAAIVAALGAFGSYLIWGSTGLILSLAVTAVASFDATFEDGKIDSVEELATGLTGLATAASALAIGWSKIKDTDFGMFFRTIAEGYPVVETFTAAFPGISGAITSFTTGISSAASAVGTFVSGISAPVWATIAAVIAGIVAVVVFLARNWDEVTEAVKKFFKTKIGPKLEEIKGHWDKMVDAIQPLIDLLAWLLEPIASLIKGFAEWWEAAEPITVLGDIFETIGGIIFSVVSGVIMGAINGLVGMIENAIQVFSGIVQIVGGVIDLVVALFTGGDIGAAWQKIWDGVVDVVSGIWDLVTKPISDFVNGIIEWFIDLWDELVGHSIVPDTIDAIVKWFCSLPDKIFGPIKAFCDGIVKKFKNLWSNVKQWYNTNVAPKFTIVYWQNVFAKVISGISGKLSELKGKISEKWQAVVDWYKASVAPKLTLSYWKNVFDKVVSGISDKLSELKGKIAEKWQLVVNWYNTSVAPKLTKSYWQGVYEKVISGISTKLSELKGKISEKWQLVVNWYKSSVAPKFTVTYWKGVLDNVVSGASSKLSELKGAISGKWQAVVDWYDWNVAPMLEYSYWTDKVSGFLDVGREIVDNIWAGLLDKWVSLKKWWADLELPEFKIKYPHLEWTTTEASGWIAETLEVLGLPTQLPKLTVTWYAQGGLPDMGELFVAREAGPELVGRIGNRTAVANNDQIVAAVSQGVYSAVVSAMNSSGGNNAQSINVYLDGKQIYNSVKKVESERGVSLMGNQLGYVY